MKRKRAKINDYVMKESEYIRWINETDSVTQQTIQTTANMMLTTAADDNIKFMITDLSEHMLSSFEKANPPVKYKKSHQLWINAFDIYNEFIQYQMVNYSRKEGQTDIKIDKKFLDEKLQEFVDMREKARSETIKTKDE